MDVIVKVVEPGTAALRAGYAHGYEQVSITAEVVFQVKGEGGRARVPAVVWRGRRWRPTPPWPRPRPGPGSGVRRRGRA